MMHGSLHHVTCITGNKQLLVLYLSGHELPLHSAGLATSHDREEFRPILVAYFTLPEGVAAKSTVVKTQELKGHSSLLSRSIRSTPFLQKQHSFLRKCNLIDIVPET